MTDLIKKITEVKITNENGSNSLGKPIGNYITIDIKDLKPEVKLPYLVRIIADRLNIRSGPGDEYNIVGSIKDKGIYTIIEQKNGYGRLKSKVGWISLSYTKKL